MTCQLSAAVYDKTCLDCMVRKIKSLRNPDKNLTLKLQRGTFNWMGQTMAEHVKAKLKEAA